MTDGGGNVYAYDREGADGAAREELTAAVGVPATEAASLAREFLTVHRETGLVLVSGWVGRPVEWG
ncbi:hypothetical protein ACVNF4_18200 [Streptomyces sp. S6]